MKLEKCVKSCSSFHSISNERRRFEELHFQNFTNRLSNQSDIIAHSRPNFMYVKTFWVRGVIYKNRGRLWSSSDCEELVGILLGGCLTVKN